MTVSEIFKRNDFESVIPHLNHLFEVNSKHSMTAEFIEVCRGIYNHWANECEPKPTNLYIELAFRWEMTNSLIDWNCSVNDEKGLLHSAAEHKDKFVERIKGWTVKSKRDFDSSEIAAIDSAIVVESKYGLSVRFNMNSGGYAAGDHVFIPLCKNSTLSVGDIVDLKTAKLNTLYHDGKDDIYIVEA